MIQDVSNTLHKTVVTLLPQGEPITRQVVETAELPASLRSYLLGILEREAERVADSINNRRDAWVAETVDVRRARTAFAVAASRNVQIPSDRVDEVLLKACESIVRYLVRPAATLQSLLFDRAEQSLDVDEINERLDVFSPYPYFREVLHHYFAEKDIEHIDRARLDAVLHRVDRQMTADFVPEEWVEMLSPLFETLAASPVYERGVPVELLQIYFREKEAGDMLLRLDEFESEDLVSQPELLEILKAPSAGSEEPPAPDRPSPSESSEASRTSAPGHASSKAPLPADEGPALPLWKQFQQRPAAASAPESGPKKAHSPEKDKPIWQQFRPDPAPGTQPVSPKRTPSDLDELERRVLGERGEKYRKLFVQNIFAGSTGDYQSALERLSHVPSWNAASQIIAREIFRKFDVNIYDEAAVNFTDLVEERFHERRT
ncbi:MAG: hypothetical protein ACOCSK_03095 [Rhodothermales bacterium]